MREKNKSTIEGNLATTGNKIESIVNLMSLEENYNKLMKLITNSKTSDEFIERFELNNMKFDENSFLSLLFYNGYVTIKEVGKRVKFVIPNYVSEVLYSNYFVKLIDIKNKYKLEIADIENSIIKFGEEGKIDEITKVVTNFFTYKSVRDRENFKICVLIIFFD